MPSPRLTLLRCRAHGRGYRRERRRVFSRYSGIIDKPGANDTFRGQGIVGPFPVRSFGGRHGEDVGCCEGAGGPADEGEEDVAVGVDDGVLGAEIDQALLIP